MPDAERDAVEEAIALTQKRSHPYSRAYALYHTVLLHGLRGEAQAAQAWAEAVIALAQQQQFPGMVVLAMQGQ